jgi:UDP-N-acetylmuramoylalanine--D-glutamate ligase
MNGGVVKSQVEIFFEKVSAEKIIGVTGTLGKGSTVSMIKHILDAAQEPSEIGGNFGIPMLDLLENKNQDKTYILELSSFQLMTLGSSPKVGVVLF